MRFAALLLLVAGLTGCVKEAPYIKGRVPLPAPSGSREPVRETFTTLAGEKFYTDSLHGQVVLVEFFATWCLPCLQVTPRYIELYEQCRDKGFTVLAVAMDEQGAQVVQPFVDYLRVPYPVVLPNKRVLDGQTPLGNVTAIPYSVLLDREGRVIEGFAGADHVEDTRRRIARLLDCDG